MKMEDRIDRWCTEDAGKETDHHIELLSNLGCNIRGARLAFDHIIEECNKDPENLVLVNIKMIAEAGLEHLDDFAEDDVRSEDGDEEETSEQNPF